MPPFYEPKTHLAATTRTIYAPKRASQQPGRFNVCIMPHTHTHPPFSVCPRQFHRSGQQICAIKNKYCVITGTCTCLANRNEVRALFSLLVEMCNGVKLFTSSTAAYNTVSYRNAVVLFFCSAVERWVYRVLFQVNAHIHTKILR